MAVPGREGEGVLHARRPRARKPFSRRDRLSLAIGCALSLAVLTWAGWLAGSNAWRDRVVPAAGASTEGHKH